MSPARIPGAAAAVLAGLSGILAAGCDLFQQEARGGGGFEGETLTLAGTVRHPDGTPAAHARVRLRATEYLAGNLTGRKVDTVTGPDGSFVLPGIPEGEYLLESSDGASLASRTTFTVEVTPAETLIVLPPETLDTTGSIRGRVVFADSSAAPAVTVRVPGFERDARTDSAGVFLLAGLPTGLYSVRMDVPGLAVQRLVDGIAVGPGANVDLGTLAFSPPAQEVRAAWKYSRRIRINTTASGANVNAFVPAYPLAIRLDSTRLDFSQLAFPDGADLRFSRTDSTPLPYEIEWIDAARKQAMVWVRVDSVSANSADQYIIMHWGKADVFGNSNSGAVFDTADGFAGVWHLDDRNPGGDATRNGNHGLDMWTTDVTGILGRARLWNNKDILLVPDSPTLEPPIFTLSCWFRRQGAQVMSAKLFFKGATVDPYATYTMDFRQSDGGLTFKISQQDGQNPKVTHAKAVADTTWAFAVATYDVAGAGKLYLNGVQVESFQHLAALKYYAPDYPFTLGAEHYGGAVKCNFKGRLDEARLMKKAISPARIKLDYESQRPGSKLLEFLD